MRMSDTKYCAADVFKARLVLLLLQLSCLQLAMATDLDSAGTAVSDQQLRFEPALQLPLSWFNGTEGPELDDGAWAPPLLSAFKSASGASTKPKSQLPGQQQSTSGGTVALRAAAAMSFAGNPDQAGPSVTEAQGDSAAAAGKEVQNDFTCQDKKGNPVDWFIVIKEQGSFKYVFASSDNSNFQAEQNIHNSGPLHNTLEQTRQSDQSKLFYAYTSHGTTANQGHQNGVLLFGTSSGFWLIHSWPTLFKYFIDKFPDPGKTKGQSFICTTHLTKDLEDIGKQLFITRPRETHQYRQTNLFNANSIWNHLIIGQNTRRTSLTKLRVEKVCGANVFKRKQSFQIVGGSTVVHYSKSRFANEDIYGWIAEDNEIDGSTYLLMVQSWQSDRESPAVVDMESHTYPNLREMNQNTDHSKWCVPVRNSPGAYAKSVKFVCIGDLNRHPSQDRRPGGAMCLFNKAIFEYFRDIAKPPK